MKFSSVIWAIPRDLISTESPPMANGATGSGVTAVILAPVLGDTRARRGPANRRGLAVPWPGDAIAWRVIAGVAAPRDLWGRRPFPAPSLHALHFPKFYPCTPILSLTLPCTPCSPRPHFHFPHDPPSWPPLASPSPQNSSPRLFACPHLHHFPAAPLASHYPPCSL